MVQWILKKIKPQKSDILGFFIFLLVFVLIVVLIPVIIKLFWGWIIPDIFPGAVEQSLITDSISWGTTFKLMIFFLFINILSVN